MSTSGIGRLRSNTAYEQKRPALKKPTMIKKPTALSPKQNNWGEFEKLAKKGTGEEIKNGSKFNRQPGSNVSR